MFLWVFISFHAPNLGTNKTFFGVLKAKCLVTINGVFIAIYILKYACCTWCHLISPSEDATLVRQPVTPNCGSSLTLLLLTSIMFPQLILLLVHFIQQSYAVTTAKVCSQHCYFDSKWTKKKFSPSRISLQRSPLQLPTKMLQMHSPNIPPVKAKTVISVQIHSCSRCRTAIISNETKALRCSVWQTSGQGHLKVYWVSKPTTRHLLSSCF